MSTVNYKRSEILQYTPTPKILLLSQHIEIDTINNQATHSLKDISPSLFTSKSIKKSEGPQHNSPGLLSPLKYPSLTRLDSEGGNTGTTARIRSAGFISNSPSGDRKDAKYSKTFRQEWHSALSMGSLFHKTKTEMGERDPFNESVYV